MKLIYRANIFEYTPRPERPYCKPHTAEAKNIKLIYRANIFDYTPRAERPYCRPRVLNWRFQTPEWRNSGCPLPHGTT